MLEGNKKLKIVLTLVIVPTFITITDEHSIISVSLSMEFYMERCHRKAVLVQTKKKVLV